jgi:hypothetical protein
LYGEIPPVQVTVAVTVALCPESIAVGERVRAGVKAEATATDEDEAVMGTGALSVTEAQ